MTSRGGEGEFCVCVCVCEPLACIVPWEGKIARLLGQVEGSQVLGRLRNNFQLKQLGC